MRFFAGWVGLSLDYTALRVAGRSLSEGRERGGLVFILWPNERALLCFVNCCCSSEGLDDVAIAHNAQISIIIWI